MIESGYYEQAFLLQDSQTLIITYDFQDGSGCRGKIHLTNKVRIFTRRRQNDIKRVLNAVKPYVTNYEIEGEEYE